MPSFSMRMNRRNMLTKSAASGLGGAVLLANPRDGLAAEADAIRPFKFHASDAELADLKRRLAYARLTESVPGQSSQARAGFMGPLCLKATIPVKS